MFNSTLCPHNRLVRIGKDFDRCLVCGQSMINHTYANLRNKTRQEWTKENKSFVRNFDRNFSNVIEETDGFANQPLYEYYTDRNIVNLILLNRQSQFQSVPPVYQIWVNGEMSYLPYNKVNDILDSVGAVRIDKDEYDQLSYGKKIDSSNILST